MKKKVSFLTLLFTNLFFIGATYFSVTYFQPKQTEKLISTAPSCNENMDQIRLSYFKYTKPLIFVNVVNESQKLSGIRSKIEQYLVQAKSEGRADDASVYFRLMNNGSWFNINPEQEYNPASLSKIIFLIAFLKDAELNPQLLEKKLYFEKHFSEVYPQNIKDFELKQKNFYTVRELLTYMIKYSDNDATVLLTQNMNMKIYKQIFTDFNIPPPPDIGEYLISTNNYSKFMRALYNATYINPQLSEYGLKLLTQSTFKDAIIKGVDPDLEVAHKFGERIFGENVQLHEFAIVYINKSPYMIGVMTKGKSIASLSEVIANISSIVYSEYKTLSQNS